MKKRLLLFLTLPLFSADSLIDALLDGNLTHKINATYDDGTNADAPYSSSKTQKVLFQYQTAPIDGVKVEVATQSFAKEAYQNSTDNTIYYTEAHYQTGVDAVKYNFSANYYADTYRNIYEKTFGSTNAVGLKAQMKLENFSSYVAYSKVMNGAISASSSLEGKDHLLPTSSVLSSNNYTPNTDAYAIDVNYALRKDLILGSRYVLATEAQTNVSYTGVYTDFKLDELSKGLNLGLSYDKTGLDKQNNQFLINVKSKF